MSISQVHKSRIEQLLHELNKDISSAFHGFSKDFTGFRQVCTGISNYRKSISEKLFIHCTPKMIYVIKKFRKFA